MLVPRSSGPETPYHILISMPLLVCYFIIHVLAQRLVEAARQRTLSTILYFNINDVNILIFYYYWHVLAQRLVEAARQRTLFLAATRSTRLGEKFGSARARVCVCVCVC